jgi:hypothetical protein
MFNNSKYTKLYYRIINLAEIKNISITIFEKHHIIPRSLGGSNKKSNLVKLTPKEHRLCHILLTKMVENPKHKISMYCAAWRTSNLSFKSGLSKGSYYQYLKEQFIAQQKSKVLSESTKQKIREARAKQTNISNQYMSGNVSGSPRKGNTKDNDLGYLALSKKLTGRQITWTDKLSESAKSRTKCSCVNCNRVISVIQSEVHFRKCFKLQ